MTPKPEGEIVEASQKSHWGSSTWKPPESISLVKRRALKSLGRIVGLYGQY